MSCFCFLLSNFVLELSEILCTSVFDEQRTHVVINEKICEGKRKLYERQDI